MFKLKYLGWQMQSKILAGIRVLVTRPVHQIQALCDMLEETGARAVCLPLIAIEPIPVSQQVETQLRQLSQISFAIFISPNAVEYGLEKLRSLGAIPKTLKLVAIGQASALKIQQILGRTADIYPRDQYNTEALLALDDLQANYVNHKHIIIFRGCGGRELLSDSLKQRGAIVSYAEVYQRIKPQYEAQQLANIWTKQPPDVITLTSNEGLMNLVSLLDGQYWQQVRQTPLVVVTEKMARNAKKIGFKNTILIANKASNQALLDSVLKWAKINTQSI